MLAVSPSLSPAWVRGQDAEEVTSQEGRVAGARDLVPGLCSSLAPFLGVWSSLAGILFSTPLCLSPKGEGRVLRPVDVLSPRCRLGVAPDPGQAR